MIGCCYLLLHQHERSTRCRTLYNSELSLSPQRMTDYVVRGNLAVMVCITEQARLTTNSMRPGLCLSCLLHSIKTP